MSDVRAGLGRSCSHESASLS